jgi:hypothetical protein
MTLPLPLGPRAEHPFLELLISEEEFTKLLSLFPVRSGRGITLAQKKFTPA